MQTELYNLPAGRELDLLVATHVMGNVVKDPDEWSLKEEIWFWEHSKHGVLIGKPYTTELMGGQYGHSWKIFTPSTDIRDAWMVLEKIRSIDKYWCPNVYWDDDDGLSSGFWCCQFDYFGEDEKDFKTATGIGDTAWLAICRASLKVVFKIFI